MSDLERRALDGDREAQGEILERDYLKWFRLYAYGHGHDEDAVSDAMFAVLRAFGSYRKHHGRPLKSWLWLAFRQALGTHTKHLQRCNRSGYLSLDAPYGDSTLMATLRAQEQVVLLEELVDLSELSPEHLKMFHLLLAGYRQVEIAKFFGYNSIKQVESQVLRLRRKLAPQFGR